MTSQSKKRVTYGTLQFLHCSNVASFTFKPWLESQKNNTMTSPLAIIFRVTWSGLCCICTGYFAVTPNFMADKRSKKATTTTYDFHHSSRGFEIFLQSFEVLFSSLTKVICFLPCRNTASLFPRAKTTDFFLYKTYSCLQSRP